jgi:hypothetical protein
MRQETKPRYGVIASYVGEYGPRCCYESRWLSAVQPCLLWPASASDPNSAKKK